MTALERKKGSRPARARRIAPEGRIQKAKTGENHVGALPEATRRLAELARRKRAAGQRVGRLETAAAAALTRAESADRRWELYRSIPKHDWIEMAGCSRKRALELARGVGVPLGRRTVDLAELVAWLHEEVLRGAILEALRRRVARREAGVPEEEGEPDQEGAAAPARGGVAGSTARSPALEEYRRERAKLARLERREREGELVAVADVRSVLGDVAARLRQAGEVLLRRFGGEAHQVLDLALEELEAAVEARLAGSGADDPPELAGEELLEPDPGGDRARA